MPCKLCITIMFNFLLVIKHVWSKSKKGNIIIKPHTVVYAVVMERTNSGYNSEVESLVKWRPKQQRIIGSLQNITNRIVFTDNIFFFQDRTAQINWVLSNKFMFKWFLGRVKHSGVYRVLTFQVFVLHPILNLVKGSLER